MNGGVAAIAYLIAQDAAITALLGARIIAAPAITLVTTLPAINVFRVSRVERLTVAMSEPQRFMTERVQVTAHAKTPVVKDRLLALVRDAVVGGARRVNSIAVDSIVPDIEGPDLSQVEKGIYEQSRDFIVKWHTPVDGFALEDGGGALLGEDGYKIAAETGG